MGDIYFTSDLHLCHNKEFIYKPRGFNSVDEMMDAILNNWNSTVCNEDTVYVLGDLVLGGNEGTKRGLELIRGLNGKIRVILGNHDTINRSEEYSKLDNVESVLYADMLKYDGYHLFLTHYPCITGNLEKESLKQCTINLFGHTHSKDKFYMDYPFMYNVALDAHNNTPVWIEKVLQDLKNKEQQLKNDL